jgi:hypothetical protein
MNGKTAKLINKVSKITGVKSRTLKRTWYDMPDQERHDWRMEMKSIIEQDNNG